MSEENFNLDSLLEDLDEAVKPSPQYSAQQTVRYMPHPPPTNKSPNQHNPKNRFAVDNSDSDRHSPSKMAQAAFQEIKPTAAFSSAYNNATGSSAFSPTSSSFDENSIDNLLDMMASPPVTTTKKTLSVFPSAEPKLPSSGSSPSYSSNKDSPPSRASATGFNYDGPPPRYSPKVPSSSPQEDVDTSSSSGATAAPARTLPSKNYGNNLSVNNIPSSHQFGSGMNSSSNNIQSSTSTGGTRPKSLNSATTSMYNLSNSGAAGSGFGSGTMPSLSASSAKVQSNNSSSLWSSSSDHMPSNSSSSGSGGASSGTKARCSRVVLGGAQMARGLKSSAFSKVCCDNLLCMACNFKIHYFPHRLWDSSVDYMFLRNNVPNEAKLGSKLVNSSDSAAYCCQCSSVNVDKSVGERQLTQGATGDPQWTCAGH